VLGVVDMGWHTQLCCIIELHHFDSDGYCNVYARAITDLVACANERSELVLGKAQGLTHLAKTHPIT
jgi:hypothetical protein